MCSYVFTLLLQVAPGSLPPLPALLSKLQRLKVSNLLLSYVHCQEHKFAVASPRALLDLFVSLQGSLSCISIKQPQYCLPDPDPESVQLFLCKVQLGGRGGIITVGSSAACPRFMGISVTNCPDRFSTFIMYSGLLQPRCST